MLPDTNSSQRARSRAIEYTLCATLLVTVAILLFPRSSSLAEVAAHSQCRFNLHFLGLALHNYHDEYGSFPPAYVADADGRPVHSWRTLLMPFIDLLPSYREYRFDEPWDGPHNAELAAELRGQQLYCPKDVYDARGMRPENLPNAWSKGLTNYVAVVGPQTAWPGARPAKLAEDFPDGPDKTILVVEVAGGDITWTEPRDLVFDDMSFRLNDPDRPSISGKHVLKGRWPWSDDIPCVHVLFADGHVESLPLDTAPERVRALLAADGGETLD